jgi:spore germination protein YaaH
VEILPTVVWARARDIHLVMSSPEARRKHVAAIVKLAVQKRFRGVDIDYEGKLQSTREHFSRFLGDLSAALHQRGKLLSCTVEARTTDTPPKGRGTGALFPWSNDLAAIGRACDRVRIMAYDQWFADHGTTTWTGKTRRPHVPNAALDWMKRVIEHFMRYVPSRKLELGVPTYGWLFGVEGKPGAWTYKRISALSHTRLLRLVKRFGAKTRRTPGGELTLEYKRKGERRAGTLCDAPCVRDRVALAHRLGLRGVVLFKIEGEEDPKLWRVLKQERTALRPTPQKRSARLRR